MARPRLSREEYAEVRAEKVAAAQAVLVDAVAAITSGEDWRRFLDFQSRLHSYSANNVLLIAVQHAQAFEDGRVTSPFPTYVAGFNTWKALGRTVEKGQKGYAVIAPMRSTRRVATSEAGDTRVLAGREEPARGEAVSVAQVIRGFGVEYVFAAEQTTGLELPEPARPELLAGEAPRGLGEAVLGLIESRGYTVTTVADAGHINGANGQTVWASKTVTVRADMDDAAMVKSLIHEAAHVLLHDPAASGGHPLPRHVKEVEAESVAYVVASVHGMPSDGYSFPYVAAWAGAGGTEVVQATATRVAQTAKAIIAVSEAEHGPGGKVPGAERAVAAAQQLRAERQATSPPDGPSLPGAARADLAGV
jgi:N-terminal domain of anti-restriction factor ArdC